MNLKIIPTPEFDKDVKSLAKKYRLIASDLKELRDTLLANPKSGIELGGFCFKIRLQNSSIGAGKSKGFRVIYYYFDGSEVILLLSIYFKGDMENISENRIKEILKNNGLI